MEPGTYRQPSYRMNQRISCLSKTKLDEIGTVFHETPADRCPLLRSYRLETGTVNAYQRSLDWITEDLNLPKPLKMAFRIWDKVSTGPEQLLQCFNSGLNMENWKILDSRDEITGR